MANPAPTRPANASMPLKGRVCARASQNPRRKPVNTRRLAAVGTGVFMLPSAGLWRTPAVNGDDWQPVSQEELKMTSVPEAPGAPAVILYRQVDRDDRKGGDKNNYIRIKILIEEGRKYANVDIPFLKEQGNIHSIKARSIRSDGPIAQFDGKVYEQTIVKAKGIKYLAKTFSLPYGQIGSIIEYKY